MTDTPPETPQSPATTVYLIGLPYDEQSSFLRGAAEAPDRIRSALKTGSSNWCAENGIDLADTDRFTDGGNVDPGSGEGALEKIEQAVQHYLKNGHRLLCLGGDHAVTYPIIRAYRQWHAHLTIVHFDAHPDLYDAYEDNRHSHACPFARIMENGLVDRLIQIGIRTLNPHQRQQAQRFGVELYEMRHWRVDIDLNLRGPVYVSLDLDVFDPAFAPGISHPEPGGLSPRELFRILENIDAPVVGADIVEYNPQRDLNDLTAMLAAKCVKELAGKMLQG